MEDIDKLLKRMNALTQRASDSSADLANFICAESIPLGEVIHDWLSSRDSHTVNITHGETEQLIKRRRITTWVKAKRRFKSQELAILADWQALEVRALALSINIVLRKSVSLKRKAIPRSDRYK
ncbi:hypothetical protein GNX18_17655 [Microbulbifer sp. SH-1]|uniref:hypothetical protein n=1 Tax=Microbulbifer sp. SH-1 TaxID=2681547 RepID=UPI001408C307|nr:hypothetical protein [Microbulbifer sp. SH-1]QIL91404.1 hypothetical protein GNX18_17655 [Microbulbifer sp. SH-1]